MTRTDSKPAASPATANRLAPAASGKFVLAKCRANFMGISFDSPSVRRALRVVRRANFPIDSDVARGVRGGTAGKAAGEGWLPALSLWGAHRLCLWGEGFRLGGAGVSALPLRFPWCVAYALRAHLRREEFQFF